MKKNLHLLPKPSFSPKALFYSTILVCLLYVFMEWAYAIDKSSVASISLFGERVAILFTSTAVLSIFCLLLFLPFFLIGHFLKSEKAGTVIRVIFSTVPAALLATMILLLVDNFTYNLWSIGVVTAKGFIRGLYAGIYVLVFAFLLTRIVRFTNGIERRLHKSSPGSKKKTVAAVSTFLLASIILPMIFNPNLNLPGLDQSRDPNSISRPNIILITVDSLNSEKLSMYGYTKDTTPFLTDLSETSLIGENHFSNAQGTIGSLTSILTGKYPAEVRVLASKDILEGEDAFQHLPGLLRKYGYETVQLSYSYYADAGNLNIQDGFDLANGESAAIDPVSSTLSALLPTDYFYFLRELYVRATDRLAHIFFIKDMTNPYKQMTESPDKFNDAYKMETALALLEESQKPLFIHIHWMGAHGPKYYPEEQVFSAGKDPTAQGNRDEDFYLDSILEFDTSLADFYSELDSLGIMDNTVLIVTSDHTQRWSISRIPLLIHFPGNEFTGEITNNTENLDISPTILDCLDIPQPDWMAGQSLLGSIDSTRPIFIAQIGDSSKDPETGKISYPESVAPFYQFGKMSVVSCDTWYKLDLFKKEFTTGKVKYYEGQCTGSELTARQALALIETHLDKYGFDISSLSDIKLPE